MKTTTQSQQHPSESPAGRFESAVSPKEFPFSRQDFDTLRSRLREVAGIALSEAKRELVYSRLAPRLRRLSLRDFASYIRLLDHDEEERVSFVNSLTTNLTSFFREQHHFDYLARYLKSARHEVRLWSAGCSTGEEPYSLAMVLGESGAPGSILATDLDSDVLRRAQEGVYASERVEGLDSTRLRRWFLQGTGRQAGRVRVKPELQRRLDFRQLNLVKESWPVSGTFHCIFCRNVAIYFDKPTQARVFGRLADHLVPGGVLMIGHSESLLSNTALKPLGQTIYKKES